MTPQRSQREKAAILLVAMLSVFPLPYILPHGAVTFSVFVVPIILAAAAGATVARSIFGETLLFSIAPIQPHSLAEMPAIVLLGLAAGTASALFVAVQARALRVRSGLPFTRIAIGGLISALAILAVPEAMGVGYDSLNAALIVTFAPSALV